MKNIRVLVVDDSALMRKLIPQMLAADDSIEVVGTAMDGEMGLKKIAELHPHVVTLDLDMPRMDGIEMLRQITRKHHVPVIVFSAQTDRSASITLKALSLGAFDFVTKPQDAAWGRIEQIAAEFALKIKVAAASGAPKMIITVPSTKRRERKPTAMPVFSRRRSPGVWRRKPISNLRASTAPVRMAASSRAMSRRQNPARD